MLKQTHCFSVPSEMSISPACRPIPCEFPGEESQRGLGAGQNW